METIRRHLRTKSDLVGVLILAFVAVIGYSIVGAYLLH